MSTELKDGWQVTAMSLRDHFAGLAMNGVLSGMASAAFVQTYGLAASAMGKTLPDYVADLSVEYADALLARLAKGVK